MNTVTLERSLFLACLLLPFVSAGGCASEDIPFGGAVGEGTGGGVDIGDYCGSKLPGPGFAWDCEAQQTISVTRGACSDLQDVCFDLRTRYANYICVWNDVVVSVTQGGPPFVECPPIGERFSESGYAGGGGAGGGGDGGGGAGGGEGGAGGGGTAGGGGSDSDSCEGYCGAQSPGGCYCDDQCESSGDCCLDKFDVCGATSGAGGGAAGGATGGGGAGGGQSGGGGEGGGQAGSAGAGGGTAGVGGAGAGGGAGGAGGAGGGSAGAGGFGAGGSGGAAGAGGAGGGPRIFVIWLKKIWSHANAK